MNDEKLNDLTRRAEALERDNRRLGLGALALAAMVTALLVAAAVPEPPRFDSVQAQQFLVVDEHGKVRGALWVDNANASTLALADDKGQVRVALRVPAQGPRLEMYSPKGAVQVTLAVEPEGPKFEVRNTEGRVVFQAP